MLHQLAESFRGTPSTGGKLQSMHGLFWAVMAPFQGEWCFKMPFQQGFRMPLQENFRMPFQEGFTMPFQEGFRMPFQEGFSLDHWPCLSVLDDASRNTEFLAATMDLPFRVLCGTAQWCGSTEAYQDRKHVLCGGQKGATLAEVARIRPAFSLEPLERLSGRGHGDVRQQGCSDQSRENVE